MAFGRAGPSSKSWNSLQFPKDQGNLITETRSLWPPSAADTIGWVRIEGVVRELFDVVALPRMHNPALIGFKTDEIRRVISIDDEKPKEF